MKKFKYVGPYDEVDVPALGIVVSQGETVDVEDTDVSAGLDGQDSWEHIPNRKRSRAAKKAAVSKASPEPPAEDSADDESQEG